MLKVEALRNDQFNLHLLERERTFDRQFLRALALACVLHAIAFVAIRIEDNITNDYSLLPPSVVTIDIGPGIRASQPSALSSGDHGGSILPRTILEPEPPAPALPVAPPTALQKHVNFAAVAPLAANAFASIERLPYTPDAVAFPFNEEHSPVTLVVSGVLAQRRLVSDGLGNTSSKRAKPRNCEQYVLRYEIQVDDKKGSIFWHSLQDLSGCDEATTQHLETIASRILRAIRFEPQRDGGQFVTTGAVELIVEIDGLLDTEQCWSNLILQLEEPSVRQGEG